MMRLKKFLVAVLVLLTSGTALAQEMPAIPQDPNVKIGHLDNGLTYYIRHNANPQGKADFYIAQKVGSLQEEESQRGLAHLLEHLAFNGSDHFKGKDLEKYLDSKGADNNAETDFDQTIYYITNMPTANEQTVDSCMLILKDWSNGITLDQSAIDIERDVVHNEYRTSMGGFMRIYERALPSLYPGSKYGVRLPIGLMSVVDGCSPETLRAYYHKWYRPDNQALIIVGDIDVDKIEAKIKELFSDIKVPADAAKVEAEPVPDTKDAIYVVDKDKEMQNNIIMVMMKHDAPTKEEKQSIAYLVQRYIDDIISQMFGARCDEKAQEPDCPYLAVACMEGNYLVSKTKESFIMQVFPKPGMEVEAYTAALTEEKRVADYGFTATEYVRAQQEYMSLLESAYNNRDKMKTEEFPEDYVENFESDEPIPSIEQKYTIMQQIAPAITIDMINQYAKELISLKDSNFVTLAMLVEKDSTAYPTPQQLADAKAKVIATPLEAYVDNTKQEPLIPETPKAGNVVKTTENKALGYKELKLSNGARIILKKTDYKDNEILMSAYAKGGYSSYPESKATMLRLLGNAVSVSGLGNFSSTELQKALAGKQVSTSMSLSNYERTISGTSTPKDIETFMQLVYLKMTNVTKDEKSFENVRQQMITIYSNKDQNPDIAFADSLNKIRRCGSKFSRIYDPEDINNVNYDEMLSTVKDFYGNAKDFTFVFVGNFDEDILIPLINTYIASLPNNGKTLKDKEMPLFSGEVDNSFTRVMATPNSHDVQMWHSDVAPITARDFILTDIAGKMLYLNYYRVIREQLSATYTPGAWGNYYFTADGKVRYGIMTSIELNPDKVDIALPHIVDGFKELSTNPSAEDLVKAKETFINEDNTNRSTNEYWLDNITTYLKRGVDMITGYPEMVNSVQLQDVKDFVNNVIIKGGNHGHLLMRAVAEK